MKTTRKKACGGAGLLRPEDESVLLSFYDRAAPMPFAMWREQGQYRPWPPPPGTRRADSTTATTNRQLIAQPVGRNDKGVNQQHHRRDPIVEPELNVKNKKLIELTTSTGYRGPDRAKIDYYFGNVDERRVVWSIGRDLMMQPPQEGGVVNALHKIHVEIDGKPSTAWTRVLTYKEQ